MISRSLTPLVLFRNTLWYTVPTKLWLTVTAQTYKRRGRKKLGERQREKERDHFVPQV